MWYAGWFFIFIGLLLQTNITLKFIPIIAGISTWIIVGILVIGAFLLAFGSRNNS